MKEKHWEKPLNDPLKNEFPIINHPFWEIPYFWKHPYCILVVYDLDMQFVYIRFYEHMVMWLYYMVMYGGYGHDAWKVEFFLLGCMINNPYHPCMVITYIWSILW